ncbi:MAG: hypothetical protein AB1641_09820 [Thermodesulfobacteriota bacterium]
MLSAPSCARPAPPPPPRWDAAAGKVLHRCGDCSCFSLVFRDRLARCGWLDTETPVETVRWNCPLPEAAKSADWYERAGRPGLAENIRAAIRAGTTARVEWP